MPQKQELRAPRQANDGIAAITVTQSAPPSQPAVGRTSRGEAERDDFAEMMNDAKGG